MRLRRFLKERAKVWRQTEGLKDEYGQPVGMWQAVMEDVPCYFQNTKSEEEFGRQNRELMRYRVWFDAGVDLHHADRIEVVGRPGLWHVEPVDDDAVLRGHHVEIVVVEVRI